MDYTFTVYVNPDQMAFGSHQEEREIESDTDAVALVESLETSDKYAVRDSSVDITYMVEDNKLITTFVCPTGSRYNPETGSCHKVTVNEMRQKVKTIREQQEQQAKEETPEEGKQYKKLIQ